jgi:hypothetical protein
LNTLSVPCRQKARPTRDDAERVRHPRSFGPDQMVRRYSADAAYGQRLLLHLNRGDANELFVDVLRLGLGKMLLLISSERVLLVNHDEADAGAVHVSWECWFGGLFGYRVVRDPHAEIVYLEFSVSEQMASIIQERLELNATRACTISAASWPFDCRKSNHRRRCDSEATATSALARIRFALNYWAQRNNLVRLTPPCEYEDVNL